MADPKDFKFEGAVEALRRLGFQQRGNIFVKPGSRSSLWVSLFDNVEWLSILAGPIFPSVNRTAYRFFSQASKGVYKPSFPAKWGPPLFTYQFDSAKDVERMFPKLDPITSTGEAIERIVAGIGEYLNLARAVEISSVSGPYSQAQMYFLPVAILELKDRNGYFEFKRKVFEEIRDPAFRPVYTRYLELLEVRYGITVESR